MDYYIYSFQMKYKGASVNGTVDNAQCKSLSRGSATVDLLNFESTEPDSTIVKGQVTTRFTFPSADLNIYMEGKSYVQFTLDPWITSAMILHTQAARVGALLYVYRDSPIAFKLEGYSRDEVKNFLIPHETTLEARNLSYDKACPIKIQDIETMLPDIAKIDSLTTVSIKEALHNALFWLHRANEAGSIQGIHFSGIHAKFRDLWSAFNALFAQENGSERENIVSYMKNRPYAKAFVSNYCDRNVGVLQRFADASLTLRRGGGNNVRILSISDEIKHFLQLKRGDDSGYVTEFTEDIESALLLCIYAVRNKSFHGSDLEAATERVRECADVLDGLLKACIIGELQSAT